MSGGLFSGLNACVTGLNSVSTSVNCISQNISIADAVAGKNRQRLVFGKTARKQKRTDLPGYSQRSSVSDLTPSLAFAFTQKDRLRRAACGVLEHLLESCGGTPERFPPQNALFKHIGHTRTNLHNSQDYFSVILIDENNAVNQLL